MDTKEAGRRGGSSRSPAKRAASRRNIAKARAVTAQALEQFRQQKAATETATVPVPETAVRFRSVLTNGNGSN